MIDNLFQDVLRRNCTHKNLASAISSENMRCKDKKVRWILDKFQKGNCHKIWDIGYHNEGSGLQQKYGGYVGWKLLLHLVGDLLKLLSAINIYEKDVTLIISH